LSTDFHSILARWRKHFYQILNVHGVNDIRQTEIHTAELLVLETSAFEVEMAVPSNAKVKRDWSYTSTSPYALIPPKKELYLLFADDVDIHDSECSGFIRIGNFLTS
jgi:hypothetical protein